VATLPPGTRVRLVEAERALLRFPPPPEAPLVVAVHPDALKAPGNRLTLVVATGAHAPPGAAPTWAGALDERMLEAVPDAPRPLDAGAARRALGAALLAGDALWAIARPAPLLADPAGGPRHTVYHGRRPWVIVGALPADADGETGASRVLAMPLNDAHGNPKWFAPTILHDHMRFPGNAKDSQLEMAHLWALPRDAARPIGAVEPPAHAPVAAAIARYFGRRA
jgi:hypothetical protein